MVPFLRILRCFFVVVVVSTMIISTKIIRPTAALALSPSSSQSLSSNKGQDHKTFNENDIEWMDDWMLRFGGVARYVELKGANLA